MSTIQLLSTFNVVHQPLITATWAPEYLNLHHRLVTRTFALVGVSVGESWGLASFAAEQSVQVGASLVLATSFNCVALGALLDEDLLSLLNITRRDVGHNLLTENEVHSQKQRKTLALLVIKLMIQVKEERQSPMW